MNAAAKIARCPTMWRWEDDGERRYIIFVNRRKELVLLNPVASLIYSYCDGSKTIPDIVDLLSRKYTKISKEKLKLDIQKFIDHMLETGIFELKVERSRL